MKKPIEINCYCEGCGNELEAKIKMSAREFNEARIDVSVCKVCERNGALNLIQTMIKGTVVAPEKKTKKVSRDSDDAKPMPLDTLRTPHKKHGRPAKVKISNAENDATL